MENERVYRLRSLKDEDPGKYLLTVYMPMPFGMGKQTFFVDSLEFVGTPNSEGRPTAIRGVLASGEMITTFSSDFSYSLVARDQFEATTMGQLKKEQEEAKKFMGGPEDESFSSSDHTGRALSGGIAL